MNLNLTEEQIAVRDAARVAQNVLKPGVIERDRDQRFLPMKCVNSEVGHGHDGRPQYGGSAWTP